MGKHQVPWYEDTKEAFSPESSNITDTQQATESGTHRKLHPTGPESVVAFMVEGDGPFALETMVEANSAYMVECDPEMIAWFRNAAPGEVFYAPIGGGATKIEAVIAE